MAIQPLRVDRDGDRIGQLFVALEKLPANRCRVRHGDGGAFRGSDASASLKRRLRRQLPLGVRQVIRGTNASAPLRLIHRSVLQCPSM